MVRSASQGRPRPGRPARISREQIVAAALEGDLSTLTMRELAARLGVTHGALYGWVGGLEGVFDLVGEVMVNRVLPQEDPEQVGGWRPWLTRLAWAMHDEFLAVPGFATRTARPHRHNPESFGRLRARTVAAFTHSGVDPALAEQSWYIFATSVISWLAVQENPLDLGEQPPRFDLFLDVLLRGLPAREPAPPARSL